MAITTKDAKDLLNQLDIDSAIGTFTLIIDKTQTNPPAPTWEDYLGRGIARCFIKDKDGLYKEAIEDLSIALNKARELPLPNPQAKDAATPNPQAKDAGNPNPQAKDAATPPLSPSKAECLCRRAYAYWLASRFDEAIADCRSVLPDTNKPNNAPPEWQAFARELLGAIHEQLGEKRQAVQEYREAITLNRNNFSLAERYRLASEKLNRN